MATFNRETALDHAQRFDRPIAYIRRVADGYEVRIASIHAGETSADIGVRTLPTAGDANECADRINEAIEA